MARAMYTITDSDYTHACAYIEDKLQKQEFAFCHKRSMDTARSELFDIVHSSQRQWRAEQLNEWCEKHLGKADWLKLKVGIRKRRERWARHDELKSVAISAKAHRLLTSISKRDSVTFSEILEHLLLRAANSASRIPKRKVSG